MSEERSDRFRYQFYTIPDIVDHIRSRFGHMVWIGKDYSIADLIRDLEQIERDQQGVTDGEETGWWGLVGVEDETK